MSEETKRSPEGLGIDLGTTHCALAWAQGSDDGYTLRSLDIPQVIAPGEIGVSPLLPSSLYIAMAEEVEQKLFALPWAGDHQAAIGIHARNRGAEVPTRLVSSAKSWLSFAGVDRRSSVLPWQAPEDVARISPLEASSRYIQHLCAAWNAAHPDADISQQDVVLTVPASFDAVARDLTVEAARLAGLGESLRLLEEPQAALYAWLAERGPAWREELKLGDVILVCDIGGGTTDFSLIAVEEHDGALQLVRIAVGEHILLGGDNMDLALAHQVKAQLEQEGKPLDAWQMRALTHSCRAAKEALLTHDAPEHFPVVIPGRTSKLIGGTLKTTLSREQVEQSILEGFFPAAQAHERPRVPRRTGLTALGLPYAADAAVTRHLSAFLARADLEKPNDQRLLHPTAVLFNGGVTRSSLIQERIVRQLSGWAESEGRERPKVLLGNHPDLAVSRGAAYYARTHRLGGVRIHSGTAQAYYVGVERAELAVPGIPPAIDALCVAPLGMAEGSEAELPETFGLIVGEPVSFRFFASTSRLRDQVGDVAQVEELNELAPIETSFDGASGTFAQVKVQARITEVGTLELALAEVESDRRWRLSFNVRVE